MRMMRALLRVRLVSQMKGYIILSKLSLPHFSPILSPSSFAGHKHTSWFNTYPKRELLTPRSFRPILVVVGLVGTRRIVGNKGGWSGAEGKKGIMGVVKVEFSILRLECWSSVVRGYAGMT